VLVRESTDSSLAGGILDSQVVFSDQGTAYVYWNGVVKPWAGSKKIPHAWKESRIFNDSAQVEIHYEDAAGPRKIWSRSYFYYGNAYPPPLPFPVEAGAFVAWTSTDGGVQEEPPESDLYVFADGVVRQLTNDDYDDFGLVASEGRIAWIRSDGVAYQILLYDGREIAEVTGFDLPESFSLMISGGYLAWGVLGVPGGQRPRCDLYFAPEPSAGLLQVVAASAAALLSLGRRLRARSPRAPAA
jgi:hypothetical protein